MRFKKIIRMFERGSVQVCGMRGHGKDMLMANVIARRKLPYVSNIDYGGNFIPFDYSQIDLRCTYRDIVAGNVPYYSYPYPPNADIYLSDCGIYFPAQYCNELNRDYKSFPTFYALLRHLSGGYASLHTNSQQISRVWDKIREQGEQYLMCNWCKLLFGGRIVVQRVTIYDKYESAVNRVRPNRIRLMPFDLNPDVRLRKKMYIDTFYNQHGDVRSHLLIYRNKAKYNTHHFKEVFENGSKVV